MGTSSRNVYMAVFDHTIVLQCQPPLPVSTNKYDQSERVSRIKYVPFASFDDIQYMMYSTSTSPRQTANGGSHHSHLLSHHHHHSSPCSSAHLDDSVPPYSSCQNSASYRTWFQIMI